ncbi:ABC-2 family transporter protein [Clostridium puniceum]|uniref:ABC-2 family transporter protein n=1 Tax=Clostridium puniceum TaxID=29367 RepID=A0A1S8TF61_9CLOT|nr:ABC transporter permease subunit [Clostridium puniceum]OOM76433.1 ABC-2 family transporter protein [Clostridium puniceum]
MLKLIENEVNKILFKKKLLLISGILLVLISLFAYGENYKYNNTITRFTQSNTQTQNYDWHELVKQQISDLKNRFNRDSNKNSTNIEIERLQYYLDNNINPITPNAAKFTINFMNQSIFLFLPLLVIILAGDIVSGEFSTKTIKFLLTRAIPRWKILLSKYIAVIIMATLMIIETAVICIIVSTVTFHTGGWFEPVATGFKVVGEKLDSSNVIRIYQWQNAILIYSLGWISMIAVASISFMVSVLVRSTATSIGIMMASLITGSFLQYFLSDWPLVKYYFAINLNLSKYLRGSYEVIPGMNFNFSIMVLFVWICLSLIVSFRRFVKQDVLV